MKTQQSDKAGHQSRGRSNNPQNPCVVKRSIRRSGLSRDSFIRALTQTAFSRLKFWTQTDLERLLLTAESLGLSPLSEDIYVAPTLSSQGLLYDDFSSTQPKDSEYSIPPITLVISLQGWMRMINSHPQFKGVSFNEHECKPGQLPEWMECSIYRGDRQVATTVREYMSEVNLMSGAWVTHPRRMLRHKRLIQCAKLAFGFPLSPALESDTEQSKYSNHLPKGVNQTAKRKPSDSADLKSWLARRKQDL